MNINEFYLSNTVPKLLCSKQGSQSRRQPSKDRWYLLVFSLTIMGIREIWTQLYSCPSNVSNQSTVAPYLNCKRVRTLTYPNALQSQAECSFWSKKSYHITTLKSDRFDSISHDARSLLPTTHTPATACQLLGNPRILDRFCVHLGTSWHSALKQESVKLLQSTTEAESNQLLLEFQHRVAVTCPSSARLSIHVVIDCRSKMFQVQSKEHGLQ